LANDRKWPTGPCSACSTWHDLAGHRAGEDSGGMICNGEPTGEKLRAARHEHQWGTGRAPGEVVGGGTHQSRGVHGGGGNGGRGGDTLVV
jgi:hypothetical protein